MLFLYLQEKRNVVNICPTTPSTTKKTFALTTNQPYITAFTVMKRCLPQTASSRLQSNYFYHSSYRDPLGFSVPALTHPTAIPDPHQLRPFSRPHTRFTRDLSSTPASWPSKLSLVRSSSPSHPEGQALRILHASSRPADALQTLRVNQSNKPPGALALEQTVLGDLNAQDRGFRTLSLHTVQYAVQNTDSTSSFFCLLLTSQGRLSLPSSRKLGTSTIEFFK